MKDTSIEPVKKPDKTPLKVGGKPIDKLKVPQLKTELGKRKFSTTGNKAELVERLQKSILDSSSDRNISRQNLNLNVNGSQEVQRNHHTEAKDEQDDEIILVGTKPREFQPKNRCCLPTLKVSYFNRTENSEHHTF